MLAILSLIELKPIDYIIHENKIEFEPIKYFVNANWYAQSSRSLSSEISNQILGEIIKIKESVN